MADLENNTQNIHNKSQKKKKTHFSSDFFFIYVIC